MRRTALRLIVASSAGFVLLFAAAQLHSARRPRYGGTLRLEMQAAVASLDPAESPVDSLASTAKERLMPLVFDTLTRLDDQGRPQPALATSWSSSADGKTWVFPLRPGVKFHDGAGLSETEVESVLQSARPDWRVSSVNAESGKNSIHSISIVLQTPQPDLPAQLAASRYSIFRRNADGTLLGTGPFKIAEWQPGKRAVVAAFEDNWEGRPFLDSIEVQMGRSPRDQLIDLEVGKADLVEIPPQQVRRATERGARVWSSRPIELLALAFMPGRAAAENDRLREALACSIDRAALVNFVLQKQGEPAGGLLPQWLSGYAFLFPTAPDAARSRELVSQISPAPAPLVLGYDASGQLEQAVAERIAVNARDVGIVVKLQALSSNSIDADVRLIRLRISSVEPGAALVSLIGAVEPVNIANPVTPEQMYARERAAVDSFRIIPLVHLPDAFSLSPQVRDWMPLRSGEWRLADVWLDTPSGDAR
jgi:peptide/nickel transport system substrate-binding protein